MARFVNVYLVSRAYGGPEEGGWYYNEGEPVRSHRLLNSESEEEVEATEQAWCDEHNPNRGTSSWLDGHYEVRVQDHPAESFPETKPYYS